VKDKLKAGIVVRELGVKLFDGVARGGGHFVSIP
jgi:hypothetical protein